MPTTDPLGGGVYVSSKGGECLPEHPEENPPKEKSKRPRRPGQGDARASLDIEPFQNPPRAPSTMTPSPSSIPSPSSPSPTLPATNDPKSQPDPPLASPIALPSLPFDRNAVLGGARCTVHGGARDIVPKGRRVRKGFRALDLFSGTGSVASRLLELGYEVVTLDLDRKMSPTICKGLLEWEYAVYPRAFPSHCCERALCSV